MHLPTSGHGQASHWRLVALFTRQTLVDPHHGSLLGVAWLLLLPLVHILIYTLVFSEFMGARLGASNKAYAYSLYLVPGLLLWGAFANTVNNMASVYTARAAIIRKIPVSLHLLPTYVPMVEFFLWAVASGLLLGFCLAVGHPLTLAWLMLPLLCVSTLLLAYGLGLLLAALSLFAPDLRPASALSIQLVFWLTPIVYLADILPPWLAGLMRYHPVYWTIAPAQHIVLHGRVGSLQPVLWQLMVAVLLIGVAAWVVRRLEKDIRDLL